MNRQFKGHHSGAQEEGEGPSHPRLPNLITEDLEEGDEEEEGEEEERDDDDDDDDSVTAKRRKIKEENMDPEMELLQVGRFETTLLKH